MGLFLDIFMLSALEKKAKYSNWEKYGFSREEADKWMNQGRFNSTSEDVRAALEWRSAGFTPEEARELRKKGFRSPKDFYKQKRIR